MQSESGIVPDFEVGEEFQEEPKTYYELKSQPLKNRSVVKPRTVIFPRCGAFWCLGDNWAAHFPKCCPGSVRVRASTAAPCCPPFRGAGLSGAAPRCYPVGIIMQRLGVVLSTSTSNISMWNSAPVTGEDDVTGEP